MRIISKRFRQGAIPAYQWEDNEVYREFQQAGYRRKKELSADKEEERGSSEKQQLPEEDKRLHEVGPQSQVQNGKE